MADTSKNNIMDMLGNILGDDKKETMDNLINTLGANSGGNTPDNLLDTAEIMSKMTRVMDKLNHTKDNREFALLYALRPYMRDTRKSKLDTCLRMMQVVGVINEMKKEG